MSAEFESGMFVRHPAWHGQGNVLDNAPNAEEAYAKSGLNWMVGLQPMHIYGQDGILVQTDWNAIVRESDGSIYGSVKGRYEPFQNRQGIDWAGELVNSGFWTFDTAGSLRGGKICWASLKQSESELIPGDKMIENLLVAWGHDGTFPVVTGQTRTRTVCMNTLQMALNEGSSFEKVRHSSRTTGKMERIQNMYLTAKARFAHQEEIFKKLLDRPVSYAEREGFIKSLIPFEDGMTERQKNGLIRVRSFLGEMCQGIIQDSGAARLFGINRDAAESAYGTMMAVQEANEHYLGGNRVKDRGYNILFGKGAEFDKKAYSLMDEFLQKPAGSAFVVAS